VIGWALPAAVLGAAVGSFLQLALDRAESTAGSVDLRARSRCTRCATALRTRDTLPIVGFLSLRGRCLHCRSPIPRRHLLYELLWAGWWAVMVVLLGLSPWLVLALSASGLPVLLRPAARAVAWFWPGAVGVLPVSVALLAWGLGGLLSGSWVLYLTGGAAGAAGLLLVLALTRPRDRVAVGS
jgi:leader peptidase (prepilin peptidase)/N-methyltransferase